MTLQALHTSLAARPGPRHSGFSLLEVMVALIVMSVGLLGIAKMQALALASTATARTRSLAALEAASLASTMRADRAYWAAVTADPNVAITGTAVTAADATLLATSPACDSVPNVCPASRIAARDLQEWATDLSQQIAGETAFINCTPSKTAPTACTINIQWKEKQIASNQQQAAAAQTPTPVTYTLYVDP